jgi:hypothetical protein
MTDGISVTLSLQPGSELRERKNDLSSTEATVRYFSFARSPKPHYVASESRK